MTSQRLAILKFLFSICPSWCSPTEIGREAGGPGRHSSWASPKCLAMVELDWLERNYLGHYRITGDGILALAKALREANRDDD